MLRDTPRVADPLRGNAKRPLIDAALAIRVAKGESVVVAGGAVLVRALRSWCGSNTGLAIVILVSLVVIFFT